MELAFVTGPEFRGRGVAGLVLDHLIRIARGQALSQLEADVLAHNHAMLAVFSEERACNETGGMRATLSISRLNCRPADPQASGFIGPV